MMKVIPALLGLVFMCNVSAFAADATTKDAAPASTPVKTQIKKTHHKKHGKKCAAPAATDATKK